MKRLLSVLGLMLAATSVHAQDVNSSNIKAQVDWTTTAPGGIVYMAGWAFDCATQGQQPYAIRLWAQPQSHTAPLSPTLVGAPAVRWVTLYRPDVAAAFPAPRCGGPLNPYTGYMLRFDGVPAGVQDLYVEWVSSTGSLYTVTRVTVKP